MTSYHLYFITFFTLLTIVYGFGTMLSYNNLAYGIGASTAVTLCAGPFR